MLDVFSLQKISCSAVADPAEHLTKLREGKNVGKGFKKLFILFAFHGIQSFQIVISTADESTVYFCVLQFVSLFEFPRNDPARKFFCNAFEIRYLCPRNVLHFPDVLKMPEILTV